MPRTKKGQTTASLYRDTGSKGSVFRYIAKHGCEDFYEPDSDASQACDALPGTPEKIAEISRRLEEGEEIFHEDDRLWHGDDE